MKLTIMSILFIIVSFFFLVLVTCEHQKHTQVILESHPGTIHPILTKELQFRCSIKHMVQSNEEEVETVPSPIKTNKDFRANPRDDILSHSSGKAQISKLLSLVLIKMDKGLNQTMASVSGFKSPEVEKQFTHGVRVEGNCESSPNPREQGYLSLILDRPTDDDAGHYMCAAFGLKSDRNPVSLIASIGIKAVEPTISDLVEFISLNEGHINDLKSKVSQLNEEKEKLRLRTKTLEEGLQNVQQALSYVMNGSFVVQSGRVQCGHQTVQFNPAYSNPPKMFLSATALSGNLRAMEYVTISYSMSITTVTSSYFFLACDIGRLSIITVDWIAIGSKNG